ncbi:hypothetical protein NITHO_2490006 [Nitrolancea hollandica Lb]|uniref:Uncharacterized protein n=1 Tax=Nitrolancea hollandica Lb TaxID=1129897 RepID=I4EFX1_9BACT|nr:hypothetical protein NITHO_2490006 [Nitrolancea hollandica Lb]
MVKCKTTRRDRITYHVPGAGKQMVTLWSRTEPHQPERDSTYPLIITVKAVYVRTKPDKVTLFRTAAS